jgi:hypothetical protein
MSSFPGKMAKFSDGKRLIVMRWVTCPTRKLHPAADCFRAAGYRVKSNALWSDRAGALWSCSQAADRDRALRICERIVDQRGKGWTDFSAWYWSAQFGKSAGPWWAFTVVKSSGPNRAEE